MLRMRFLVSVVSLVVLGALASLPSCAAQTVHPSRSKLQPCKVPGEGVDTSCLSQVKPKPFLVEPPAKGCRRSVRGGAAKGAPAGGPAHSSRKR